jgi:hypothetical protein
MNHMNSLTTESVRKLSYFNGVSCLYDFEGWKVERIQSRDECLGLGVDLLATTPGIAQVICARYNSRTVEVADLKLILHHYASEKRCHGAGTAEVPGSEIPVRTWCLVLVTEADLSPEAWEMARSERIVVREGVMHDVLMVQVRRQAEILRRKKGGWKNIFR